MIRILRILAPNPGPFTLEGTNTWVLGANPSVVIDPGPDDAAHVRAVADAASPIAAVLLTHRHEDHAPGARALSEASGAPIHAFHPEEGERQMRDRQLVEAGQVHLRVVHAPGHTRDHVVLLLEPDRQLFTGDAVLGRGTSVVNPPEGDMAAYLRSLRAMLALRPRALYPGHGPVVLDARAKLEEYLAHRAEREEQVLDALTGGPATPLALVPGIYGDEAPEALYPAAARSLLAHLLKLEREGRVARRGRPSDERFALVEAKACERCGRPAVPRSRYCSRCAVAALQEGPRRGS